MEVPFYTSADRNKEAIGDALSAYLARAANVLEIGSGSGQHAIYLCQRFSHLQWQVTEQAASLEGLRLAVGLAVDQSGCKNIQPPIELDVSSYVGSENNAYAFVYSANTAHIMGIEEVKSTFKIVNRCMAADGLYALYGPFKENGQHNSEGNVAFDEALRSEDPKMGIRDITELSEIAMSSGLALLKQIDMPSNNRILLWQKA